MRFSLHGGFKRDVVALESVKYQVSFFDWLRPEKQKNFRNRDSAPLKNDKPLLEGRIGKIKLSMFSPTAK